MPETAGEERDESEEHIKKYESEKGNDTKPMKVQSFENVPVICAYGNYAVILPIGDGKTKMFSLRDFVFARSTEELIKQVETREKNRGSQRGNGGILEKAGASR